VCKPFGYGELRARLGALMRRADQRRGSGRLRVGPLEVDPPSREVSLRGERVELSQKEYAARHARLPTTTDSHQIQAKRARASPRVSTQRHP